MQERIIQVAKIGRKVGLTQQKFRLYWLTDNRYSQAQTWYVRYHHGGSWHKASMKTYSYYCEFDQDVDGRVVNGALGLDTEELSTVLADNEYYVYDLLDKQVYNLEGYHFGKVNQVINLPTTYALQCGTNYFIPFLAKYICSVSEVIVVDWQPEFNS